MPLYLEAVEGGERTLLVENQTLYVGRMLPSLNIDDSRIGRAHCRLRAFGGTVICEPQTTNMYVNNRRMPGHRYILCPGSTITMLPPSVSDPHAYIVINSEDEDTQPCVEESDGLEQQVDESATPEQLMVELAAARQIIAEQEARAVAAEMEVRRLQEENQKLLDDLTALDDAARCQVDSSVSEQDEDFTEIAKRLMNAVAIGQTPISLAEQQATGSKAQTVSVRFSEVTKAAKFTLELRGILHDYPQAQALITLTVVNWCNSVTGPQPKAERIVEMEKFLQCIRSYFELEPKLDIRNQDIIQIKASLGSGRQFWKLHYTQHGGANLIEVNLEEYLQVLTITDADSAMSAGIKIFDFFGLRSLLSGSVVSMDSATLAVHLADLNQRGSSLSYGCAVDDDGFLVLVSEQHHKRGKEVTVQMVKKVLRRVLPPAIMSAEMPVVVSWLQMVMAKCAASHDGCELVADKTTLRDNTRKNVSLASAHLHRLLPEVCKRWSQVRSVSGNMQCYLTMPGYNDLNEYNDRQVTLAAHFQHQEEQSSTALSSVMNSYAWSRTK